jgi:hypothetical protein
MREEDFLLSTLDPKRGEGKGHTGESHEGKGWISL